VPVPGLQSSIAHHAAAAVPPGLSLRSSDVGSSCFCFCQRKEVKYCIGSTASSCCAGMDRSPADRTRCTSWSAYKGLGAVRDSGLYAKHTPMPNLRCGLGSQVRVLAMLCDSAHGALLCSCCSYSLGRSPPGGTLPPKLVLVWLELLPLRQQNGRSSRN
jgi:hypothetical protein